MKIPPWVLEGSNGALAFTLLMVFCFQVSFLITVAVKIQTPSDMSGSAVSYYRQMKPVIALTFMAFGFVLRFADNWIRYFADNRGISLPDWWAHISISLYVSGTAAAIIGVLCWLRVTIPKFCGTSTWVVIVILSAIIGVLPAFV